MDYFVHELGLCESTRVASGTRIWAFAHVLPGAVIGADCNICDHVFIENDVVLGDRVTVKSGVQLWDGIRIADDVFIGPNATFTNDRFPRSKAYPEEFPTTRVEEGASIGANATILPASHIGRHAMVGAGAVVIDPVPPHAIVVGNPARIVGYVTDGKPDLEGKTSRAPETHGTSPSLVKGVCLYRFPVHEDRRGALTVGNFSTEVPFVPQRYFVISDVPSRAVRGEHAHMTCDEFLVCVNGSVRVFADDSNHREEFLLDERDLGLHLPAGTWTCQYAFSEDAVLLVFAPQPYDPEGYIRDYGEFLNWRAKSEDHG